MAKGGASVQQEAAGAGPEIVAPLPRFCLGGGAEWDFDGLISGDVPCRTLRLRTGSAAASAARGRSEPGRGTRACRQLERVDRAELVLGAAVRPAL
ncbi:hypothetical protein SDC9_12949 [bioreactor metagenome]|uniref:Uncharacterized protein n=1 Tax=bioreactor metagenome TaxID=1076179 RepID=A0A644TJX1_9ZZZZ